MPRKAAIIHLTPETHEILTNIARSRTLGIDLTERAKIILAASQGLSTVQIAEQEHFERHRVAHWRNHWIQSHGPWQALDEKLRPPMSQRLVLGWLTDQKGRGRKATITPEQKARILAVACEAPSKSGYPHSHWTCRLLAQEVIKRGIVTYIAFQTVCSFLNEADLKPHKSRYWLNPRIEDQEVFEQEVKEVCQTYLDAEDNAQNGIHTVSTDEKTGIQALERTEPDQPMEPGQPVRREYNYERHGTSCLFGNIDVASGDIVAPKLHPTRTEEDFADNIDAVVSTDPEAGWIFVLDNLNTHCSATLVFLVALLCNIPFETLGEKGKSGVLKNQESRKRFLGDKNHRIRFVYTPKHCSWLNQIEIWFSGLGRRVLNRGSFASLEEMNAKILDYIKFYNATAKPMNWKFDGNFKERKVI